MKILNVDHYDKLTGYYRVIIKEFTHKDLKSFIKLLRALGLEEKQNKWGPLFRGKGQELLFSYNQKGRVLGASWKSKKFSDQELYSLIMSNR